MARGLLDLHNILRWVVLILALATILRSFSALGSGKKFEAGHKKLALFFMISMDVQLLVGLSLYFMNGWWDVLTGGNVMSNAYTRFFAVEHFLGMLIAIVLVHLGYSATKKNIPDAAKFKKLIWYTVFALVIIIISIPWPFREAVARSWFPGMDV